MSLGDNIRELRVKKGLTQKQLADSCGIVDATIRTYELGKSNPKAKTVAKIAKALDVSTAELYGVDWVPGIESQDSEMDSALYQSLLSGQNGVLTIKEPDKVRLMVAFDKLNKTGQAEAIKRIEEMTQLPAYLRLTPDSVIVGKKIRQARNERGLTYQQLGELSNISVETLQQIELGIISPECLRPLSKALGLTIFELLNFTPEEQREVDNKRKAVQVCDEIGLDPNSDEYKTAIKRANDRLAEIIDAAIERLQISENPIK